MVSIKRKVTLRTKVAPEKPSEHAEIPKVTLKKKQAEPEVAPEPKPLPRAETRPAENTSGAGKLAAGIAAAAIVIVGAFFLISRNADNGEATPGNGADNTLVAQNEAASEPAKEAASDNALTEAQSNHGAPAAAEAEARESVAASEERPNSSEAASAKLGSQPKAEPQEERKQAEPEATGRLGESEIEAKAMQVIRGDFGNGRERKDRLGANYADIQSRVNDMYRRGLVR